MVKECKAMSNFEYLKNKPEFSAFADVAVDAEKSLSVSERTCALASRTAAEAAVKWLYDHDSSLTMPYKDNLSALIYNQSFMDTVTPEVQESLRYVVKLGNLAAHTGKAIAYREAVLSLRHLFLFTEFIDCCYGAEYTEKEFDETILHGAPTTAQQHKPKDATEAETRRSIIDIDIQTMGWTIGVDCIEEVEVFGLPNTASGSGFSDYVLKDDNGVPLAVVEAKRSSKDARAGLTQAQQYATALEKKYGTLPIVFCTNGYETIMWDGIYPERPVFSVFSKDDLRKLINRRSIRGDFSEIDIDDDITDRPYQKMAIHAVCSHYKKNNRKTLLAMATGTGKTRTAASLVDVLGKQNWITNILFLADRRELVKQAKGAFTKHLPNLSVCNLSQREPDEKPTARAIFSTYPTMMNAIDNTKTENGDRLFTPAHFDLIIIDEAHRSIFKKYRAIFKYFDALIIGLTATPRNDVDRNTYDFFDMEPNMPTYAYEYETAVNNVPNYLSPYYRIEKLFKLPVQGMKRDELSDEDQLSFEDVFEEGEEVPDFVSADEFNRVYMNKNTVDRVLEEVMTKGLKVEGGDKLGKTIIFSRNHKHAMFIKDRFDALYPEYAGLFARVIDTQAEDKQNVLDQLLADFKTADKMPQIAISVDMLDTGIDVPEILNLVYFKRVMSRTKFWQMFGRGTRLCKDLLGPGKDKECFYVFDYMGNFAFFDENQNGKEATPSGSLAEESFKLKIRMINALQGAKFDTEECALFREKLVDEVSVQVATLNKDKFDVRAELRFVDRYSQKNEYQAISLIDAESMISHLANLIPATQDDEKARRFDILMYRFMLAHFTGNENTKRSVIGKVKSIALALQSKFSIPDVKAQKETIQRVQQDNFWQQGSVDDWEQARINLRDLLFCLKNEYRMKVIDISDEVLFEREGQPNATDKTFESYYARAQKYVADNMNKSSLRKLRENQPLTDDEWSELERIFWSELGSKEEYEVEANNVPLGRFLRSLTQLSTDAVNAAFSEFLNQQLYSEEQIQFVNAIIGWLTQNGTLLANDLVDDDNFGGLSVADVFRGKMATWKSIQETIYTFNRNARVDNIAA
jgi:type I restriction enzyme R subunit